MRFWVIFSFISILLVTVAYSKSSEFHEFEQDECRHCHVDVEKTPGQLKPVCSSACLSCHNESDEILSHPMGIFPEMAIPADMPLENGKLDCITCHFVHPFSIKAPEFNFFLLRRQGRGPVFCSACHKLDEKGHIMFEKVHTGSYRVKAQTYTVDELSLQCIECHDRNFRMYGEALGSGEWSHSSATLKHPIGVPYGEISSRLSQKFRPQIMLPEEIRLFEGKIGCGTCHSTYSKENFMLSMSNSRNRLCLSCHIK